MLEIKKISDYVYDEILKNIIELKYAPGTKLSEVQLSKELGVSRAPIKSALSKLESKGLVDIRPQYGTFVCNISPQRARDICQIRLLLEKHAVRHAAVHITAEQLEQLENQLAELEREERSDKEYQTRIYETDELMHNLIYEAGGNSVIREVIEQYRPEIRRIQYANMEWGNRKKSTVKEMKDIFAALKARDPEQAEAAMMEHLSNIRKTVEAL